ncbi:flagellar protein [Marinomonas sp. S3726]|uniref:flagellar basal body P-ring formation chaperone FlgA n=1 Tax=Marinomonas sp. S3726 TaxID=579484 RepID=UPI0005F9B693|nr:flagellar basal body P-ring formation chaperone FlgA [Marinomonas sp. S3726]KJZ14670.1 flagellar protein [Marinomonas sp. S3726]
MKQYKLISIIFALLCNNVFAATTEEQINYFIKNIELPRLASSYPNAEIIISLENRGGLNYLPACDQAISVENQRVNSKKRTTYAISCQQPEWKSFIPVSQKILVEAIKAIAPIRRKQTIDASNTVLDKVDLTQVRGQVYSPSSPPYGLIAKRNININTFITKELTELPIIVKRGQNVLISAQSGLINVKMNGVAAEDGTLGQQIKVKNVSSGRFVYGKVVSEAEIRVNY